MLNLRWVLSYGVVDGRLVAAFAGAFGSLPRQALRRATGWLRFVGCGVFGAAGAPPSRVPSSLVTPRYVLPFTNRSFPLKLNPFLGFYALVFEGVFDHFHFGDGVGEVDELLGGVAAGDDGVLHGGAGL